MQQAVATMLKMHTELENEKIILTDDASCKVIRVCISRATTPPQVQPLRATEYPLCKLPKHLYPARTTSGAPKFFLCSNLKKDDDFYIPQTSTESNPLLERNWLCSL